MLAYPHQVVEGGAHFEGAYPLGGAHKGRLLVAHLHQGLLDLVVGGWWLLCVALQYEPRPQRLQGAVGTPPTLYMRLGW